MNRFQRYRREVPAVNSAGTAAQAAVAVAHAAGGDAAAAVAAPTDAGGNYAERVVWVGTPGKSLTIAAWYRGVSLLMRTMGQLVPQYQRKNKEGGNFVENLYGKAGLLNYKLQVRPNPIMTATTFWQQVEYMKIMYGNALVYIERGADGEPHNFWLCNNGCYDEMTGIYVLQYLSDKGPVQVTVEREDVLHWANTYHYPGSIWGISTLQFAAETLSTQATENRQVKENAAKGGRFKVLVQEKDAPIAGTRGRANQAELRKITRQLNNEMYEGDAIFLNNVADAKPFSMNAQQMQLLEQLGFGVAEVGRFLGVPLSLLMDYSNSSYKTPEAATQELLQRTIQPQIGEVEDELNAKLLLPEDWGSRRFHVCELPLLRLDMKSQTDIDLKRLQTGWSPNEIRAQYDMPAVDGGDDHLVSMNLGVVGSQKMKGEQGFSLPAEPTKPNGQEEDEE